MVEVLVKAGCDVDVRDHALNTPLHLAAGEHLLNPIRLLIVEECPMPGMNYTV